MMMMPWQPTLADLGADAYSLTATELLDAIQGGMARNETCACNIDEVLGM